MANRAVQILLIEDSKAHLKLICDAFKNYSKDMYITVAGNLEEAFQFMQTTDPDLILADFLISGGSNMNLLSKVQGKARYPVVVMTSQGSEDLAVEAMKSGALDYVVKSDSTLIDMPHIAERALREWAHLIELKKAEKLLKTTRDDLEIRVQERTAELEIKNRELEKEIEEREQITKEMEIAKEEAEAANHAKSEFLANMSHELRTPLHAVLSYSRFGVDKIDRVDKDKLLKYFSRIEESGKKLQVLLTDLLDLSKMESGRMTYQMYNCKVMLVIKNVVNSLKTKADKKRLVLEITNPENEVSIVCDQNRIEQVIHSIVSNSIKFSTEDGQISISVEDSEIINNETVEPALKVIVKDQGIGIPKLELESVFEKFIQSTKTKNGAGGKGLGLSIANEIVRYHNGKLWAENSSEGGAVFYVLLPLKQENFIAESI